MKKILYSVIIALVISLAMTVYTDSIENDLENNLIRLHIIANSDSEEDQTVKLLVRDAVTSELDCSLLSPDEAAAESARIAQRVLSDNGFDYGAYGEFTTMEFPKKEYKELVLPAGRYKAVRIVLGNGSGHNWWCVLYPPVCMADIKGGTMSEEARRLLQDSLDEETYSLITQSKDIKIKLRSVEIFEKIKRAVCGE